MMYGMHICRPWMHVRTMMRHHRWRHSMVITVVMMAMVAAGERQRDYGDGGECK